MKKKLQQYIERHWYDASPGVLWLLYPLELIFRMFAQQRKRQCLVKPRLVKPLPVPIVIVGNIHVGGTGKTPIIITLAKHLKSLGYSVGVISRGYGRQTRGLQEVFMNSTSAIVGDEPIEIVMATGCPMMVDENRMHAALSLYEKYTPDIILSDDGLQHYGLPRDVELAVVNAKRWFGNQHCLPVGPLREPMARLQDVDYLLVSGHTDKSIDGVQTYSTRVQPVSWTHLHSGEQYSLETVFSGPCVAITGLGQPDKFFSTLSAFVDDASYVAKPDHYAFSAEDFSAYQQHTVFITAKDAVKCRGIAPENTFVLHIEASLPSEFLQNFQQKLAQKIQS